MKQENDLGLELYVATQDYQDRQQYLDSQKLLSLIEKYGLSNRMDIIPLENMDGQRELFKIITDPKKELRLPYLVSAHGCMTSAILGHSGLEEVTEMLNSLIPKSLKDRILIKSKEL